MREDLYSEERRGHHDLWFSLKHNIQRKIELLTHGQRDNHRILLKVQSIFRTHRSDVHGLRNRSHEHHSAKLKLRKMT